ncbi:MAG: hypothetical protein JNJ72_19570, partial [Anaerolineales bacterium]|nr:hypothetical protein [Anaerolineales bacterium]
RPNQRHYGRQAAAPAQADLAAAQAIGRRQQSDRHRTERYSAGVAPTLLG